MRPAHLVGDHSGNHPSQALMGNLVRLGHFPRPTSCVSCGQRQSIPGTMGQRVVWHHASYRPEHATHVVALCRSCHGRVHSGRIPDPGLLLVTYPSASDPVDADLEVA